MDPAMGRRRWACARSLGGGFVFVWVGLLFAWLCSSFLLRMAGSTAFVFLTAHCRRPCTASAPPPTLYAARVPMSCARPNSPQLFLLRARLAKFIQHVLIFVLRLKRKIFRAGTVGFGWSSLHLARVFFVLSPSRSCSCSSSSVALRLLIVSRSSSSSSQSGAGWCSGFARGM